MAYKHTSAVDKHTSAVAHAPMPLKLRMRLPGTCRFLFSHEQHGVNVAGSGCVLHDSSDSVRRAHERRRLKFFRHRGWNRESSGCGLRIGPLEFARDECVQRFHKLGVLEVALGVPG